MKVPSMVPILGYQVAIVYRKEKSAVDGDGNVSKGEYSPDTKSIEMWPAVHLNADELMRTIYHESTHAMLDLSGQACLFGKREEEAMCELFANAGSRLFVFGPNSGVKYKDVEMPWEEDSE